MLARPPPTMTLHSIIWHSTPLLLSSPSPHQTITSYPTSKSPRLSRALSSHIASSNMHAGRPTHAFFDTISPHHACSLFASHSLCAFPSLLTFASRSSFLVFWVSTRALRLLASACLSVTPFVPSHPHSHCPYTPWSGLVDYSTLRISSPATSLPSSPLGSNPSMPPVLYPAPSPTSYPAPAPRIQKVARPASRLYYYLQGCSWSPFSLSFFC